MGPAAAEEAPLGERKRGAWLCQVPESRLPGPGRPGAASALAVQAAGGSPAWPWLCERARAAPGAQRALDPLRLWMGAPAPALVVAAALWQPRRSPRGPRPWLQRTDRRCRRRRGRRHCAPWLPAPRGRLVRATRRPGGHVHATHASRMRQASGDQRSWPDRQLGCLPGRARTISLGVFDLGDFGAPVGGSPSGLPLRLCRCCPSPVRPETG